MRERFLDDAMFETVALSLFIASLAARMAGEDMTANAPVIAAYQRRTLH